MVYRFVGKAVRATTPAPSETSTGDPRKPEAAGQERVGRRGRAGGLARVAAVAIAAAVLALALPARPAFAFCRTTTCAVLHPPDSCMRDMDTGCWLEGIPLFWQQQCLSYAVNTAG